MKSPKKMLPDNEDELRKIILGIISEEVSIYHNIDFKNKTLENIVICWSSKIKKHRKYTKQGITKKLECYANLVPIDYLDLSPYLQKKCNMFGKRACNHIFIEDNLVERQKGW
jgi:dynactin complex subunit